VEKTRKQFTSEFRLMVVSRMKTCVTVVGLARELGVRAKLLHRWRARLEGPTMLASRLISLFLKRNLRRLCAVVSV